MISKLNYKNYIIVKGVNLESYYDKYNQLLNINCNDKYERVSEKVLKIYNYIINNIEFNNYNYFFKLDNDMIITKLINENYIKNYNYCGKFNINYNGNHKWHI